MTIVRAAEFRLRVFDCGTSRPRPHIQVRLKADTTYVMHVVSGFSRTTYFAGSATTGNSTKLA